jgi:DNA invertase Pin-like site-specific DNA recombinase
MSTDLQLLGDSLRRQTEASKKYAEDHGLELVTDFELSDIGVSAYKGANVSQGALGKFLDAVKLGEIPKGSYLLVESFDRLSRQKTDQALSLFLEITQSNINLVTLVDGQLYEAGKTEFHQLIYSIVVMARAHEESETKSKRISEAWQNKRDNLSKEIFTRMCPAWLDVSHDKTKFIENEKKIVTLRRIFDEAISGLGAHSITRRLNADQVPAFGISKSWNESYVVKILKNRAVLGEFQPHKRIDGRRTPFGDTIPGYYPRIISEDIFLSVQIIRRSRGNAGGGRRGMKQRNLFSHLAKCQYCGASMRFLDKGPPPKGGTYLRCSTSLQGGQCISKSWKYDDFENSFFSFVREIDLQSIVAGSMHATQKLKLREQELILEEKLNDLVVQRDNIISMDLSGEDARKYVSLKIDEITKEIGSVEERLLRCANEAKLLSDPTPRSEQSIAQQVKILREFGREQNFERRSRVSAKLKTLVSRIDLSTVGNEPGLKKSMDFVDENEADPVAASKLKEAITNSHFDSGKHNPYFMVTFFDQKMRLVIPSKGNPSVFHTIVNVDHKGAEIENARGYQRFRKANLTD